MRTPKYRKKSNREYGFVEWRGKRHRLPGKYNSAESKRAYNEFLSRYVYGSETPEASKILSIGGLCLRFADYVAENYPSGSRSSGANLIRSAKLLRGWGAALVAKKFGPLRLKEFRRSLVGRGLSRGYINQVVGQVKQMFRWAASEELVPASVYHSLVTVAGLERNRGGARETSPRQPVQWQDVEPVFEYLNETVSAMLWLQWFTGVRSQSVCLSKPGQFERGNPLWLWRPRHKTEARFEVVLPVGPKCQAKILPFFEAAGEYLFEPRRIKPNPRYRNHYDADTYRRSLQRAQKKAGVNHWFPHQLRHARGTFVRQKYGAEAAQAVLGHERLETTQIYAQRQLELAKRVALEEG